MNGLVQPGDQVRRPDKLVREKIAVLEDVQQLLRHRFIRIEPVHPMLVRKRTFQEVLELYGTTPRVAAARDHGRKAGRLLVEESNQVTGHGFGHSPIWGVLV